MAWIELELLVDRDAAPLIEAALENAGALAVTLDQGNDEDNDGLAGLTDADAAHRHQVLEPAPGETPLWRQLRITALFDASPAGSQQAESAAQLLTTHCLAPPSLHRLEDQPWERLWLEGLQPQRFGERLWICPRGHAIEAADAVVIDLDPGLAFGTGHHATTALCLEWLDRTPLAGSTLIDFGCGSGILAIAALKLGAVRALAVDHDPQALEATLENARANGVDERLSVCEPGRMPRETADLLVANILAGPLVELAPTLSQLTRPGGQLALSGILLHQADNVSSAYRATFALEPPLEREDWVLISGQRRASP
ncbi:50S ribosomal protein L11 methyltransferase [Lamprobacter modestohalophilus]|uniref:Ribosomal protein L11 methyltransferase n=1 Tax=Lamprobacter modestohalophilus TaxID=1064514 RepID=A0A9X1B3R3_9GAMM|nr:50S ribosomal protein L11 methyltransferase [Lamprobacter modestohalophilus]MBK1618690.1 50S ribosomal protein L11 methyltransferase [Lamprobacter modestohalophilus]